MNSNLILITDASEIKLNKVSQPQTIYQTLKACHSRLVVAKYKDLHILGITQMTQSCSQRLYQHVIAYLASQQRFSLSSEIIWIVSAKQLIDQNNTEVLLQNIECLNTYYLKPLKTSVSLSIWLTDLDYLCGFESFTKAIKIKKNAFPYIILNTGMKDKSLLNTLQQKCSELQNSIEVKMPTYLADLTNLDDRLRIFTLPSQLERLTKPLLSLVQSLSHNLKGFYPRTLKYIYFDQTSLSKSADNLILKPFIYHISLIKAKLNYIVAAFILFASAFLVPHYLQIHLDAIKTEQSILKSPLITPYNLIKLYLVRRQLNLESLELLTSKVSKYIPIKLVYHFPPSLLSINPSFNKIIKAYTQLIHKHQFTSIEPLVKQQLLAIANRSWQHTHNLNDFEQTYIEPLAKAGLITNYNNYRLDQQKINTYKNISFIEITPLSLSSKVSKVKLRLGVNDITYKHGPVLKHKLILNNYKLSPCKIDYIDFNGHYYSKRFDSQYCLAHILDKSRISNNTVTHCYSKNICFSFLMNPAQLKILNLKFPLQPHLTHLSIIGEPK